MELLLAMFVIGCGGSSAGSAVQSEGRASSGIALGVIDATHSGHEALLRASAQKHIDAIRTAQRTPAMNVEVSLVTLEKPEDGTVMCAIQIVVLGGGDAVWRGTASAAYTDGPAQYEEAVGDCIEGVVGDLVDQRLAALVKGRPR